MSDNTLKLIVETINMHEIKESYTGTNVIGALLEQNDIDHLEW